MDLHFSEFSYGYAVTEEITRLNGPLAAAPAFPSLAEEGMAGRGYDVRIDLGQPAIPLFLQFKLSEYISRRRADQQEAPYWVGQKFFRVRLRTKRPNQHQLLLDLEAGGNQVYYVAPSFHLISELNIYYSGRRVLAESAIVSPGALGPYPEGEPHHFSFRHTRDGNGYKFSEPEQFKVQSFAGIWDSYHARLRRASGDPDALPAGRLLERVQVSMLEALRKSEHEGLYIDPPGQFTLFEKVSYLARVAFDATFVLVGLPQRS